MGNNTFTDYKSGYNWEKMHVILVLLECTWNSDRKHLNFVCKSTTFFHPDFTWSLTALMVLAEYITDLIWYYKLRLLLVFADPDPSSSSEFRDTLFTVLAGRRFLLYLQCLDLQHPAVLVALQWASHQTTGQGIRLETRGYHKLCRGI